MNNEAIKALKELAENTGKRSKIGIVRELMPHIEETMKQGVTLADIHAALTEKAGIDIKFLTFIGSYKRIKKEIGKNTQQRLKPLTPEKNIKTEPSPIQEKPKGFFFDPSPKKEDWL
ncbi:hypothetical protein [Methylomonas albis]|uniref:Uncharacterized protein n=1 Tax=Methylomonas albis TaxID=1854563 RepID=A0ABR9DAL2_9GAMM|nr:hypothetical protein [Methylomonas albis]MBD9358942.1 hypothetical protein [Methylomonas albis]CAD6882434.1 hypothetical protein [Methylomonas albis]